MALESVSIRPQSAPIPGGIQMLSGSDSVTDSAHMVDRRHNSKAKQNSRRTGMGCFTHGDSPGGYGIRPMIASKS